MHPDITPHIDVALIVLNAFFLFFIGLIFYLRREDRREGYPLEDEMSGRLDTPGGVLLDAGPKTFHLPFGHGTSTTPTKGREPVDIAARRTDRFAGAPYAPTGNPLVDGIGPAAWANRAKRPDLDMEGHARIVPLSSDGGFYLERKDPDPRGMPVIGADGLVAGTVSDVWIDKADRMVRYLQITLSGGTPAETPAETPGEVDHETLAPTMHVGREILAPMMTATIEKRNRRVVIDALLAHQFADAPAIESSNTITLYEEDRVQAYFGGGYLYATPERSEPFL